MFKNVRNGLVLVMVVLMMAMAGGCKDKNEKNNDATLSMLKVTAAGKVLGLNPTFNKNTLAYSVTVPATAAAVNIEAVTSNSKAKVVSGAGETAINGIKSIEIKVQAEDETAKIYKLTINKEEELVTVSAIDIIGNLYVEAGSITTFGAVVKMSDNSTTTAGITFDIADKTVAVVTAGGIKGVKAGTTTLSAVYGSVTATKIVTVKEKFQAPKFSKVNIVGTINGFKIDEVSKMRYLGDDKYEINITAPAPSAESWIPKEYNHAIKFVGDEDWGKGFIGENGKLAKDTGMGNLYVNLTEGTKYCITVDFGKMEYSVVESYSSMSIAGTVNGFKFTPMNYVDYGKYQVTLTAPAPSTESWIPKEYNHAVKFVGDEDWAKGFIGENGKIIKDTGMGNLYVNLTEGKLYSITADFINMNYTVTELSLKSLSIAGTINGFKFTPMTNIGGSIYTVTLEAPAPSTESWIPKEYNQAIKFVGDEDWGKAYLGENGKLAKDTGMGNLYVNMVQGEYYKITADMDALTYSVEKVDSPGVKLVLINGGEFANISNTEVKFLFKGTKGATARLFLGESDATMAKAKEIANYNFESAEGFKVDGLTAGKKYFYKIEIEKDGKKAVTPVYNFVKDGSMKTITKPDWARKTVFYEILVRSFADGNGDGIGDFIGLKNKISYLKELGVTGVWLMPMNESPTYHGYDVIDYRTIEKDYGGMEAFDAFLAEAHANGIKVVMDFVVNHTCDESAWFKDAVANENSVYKDFYVWANEFDKIDDKWYDAANGKKYYSFYSKNMPDMNYRNPAVRAQIKEEAKFWIDKGIDGFRLDGADNFDLDDDVELGWWKEFSSFVNTQNPEVFVVGENNFPGNYEKVAPFFGAMQSSFNFYLYDQIVKMSSGTLFDIISGKHKESDPVGVDSLTAMYEKYYSYSPDLIDSTFTGNHDKPRMQSMLQKDPALAPTDMEKKKAKLAASMLFTLPGAPFFYYGEELGQIGGIAEKDENKREPMDWYKSASGEGMTTMDKGGFTIGAKHTNPDDGISLEEQKGIEGSIYEHYKKLISIRKEHDYMFTAKPEWMGTPEGMYGYEIKGGAENIYVVHNVTGKLNAEIGIAKDCVDLITGKAYTAGAKLLMSEYQTVIFAGTEKPISEYVKTIPEKAKSKVKITLHAPANTPADDQIFMPGSLNEWGNNDAVPVHSLTKTAPLTYEITIEGEEGTLIEYKFVRGTDGKRDWNKDGLDKDGQRLGTNNNYRFTASDESIEHTIYGWLDLGMPQ